MEFSGEKEGLPAAIPRFLADCFHLIGTVIVIFMGQRERGTKGQEEKRTRSRTLLLDSRWAVVFTGMFAANSLDVFSWECWGEEESCVLAG